MTWIDRAADIRRKSTGSACHGEPAQEENGRQPPREVGYRLVRDNWASLLSPGLGARPALVRPLRISRYCYGGVLSHGFWATGYRTDDGVDQETVYGGAEVSQAYHVQTTQIPPCSGLGMPGSRYSSEWWCRDWPAPVVLFVVF